jgi:hypothetical protein
VIQVELYGVARLRAGIRDWTSTGGTLGEVLESLAVEFPMLEGSVVSRQPIGLLPSYRISLNGDRFVSDPNTLLANGDHLLILSADVGG